MYFPRTNSYYGVICSAVHIVLCVLQSVQRFLPLLLAAGGDGGGELGYNQLCGGSMFETQSKDGSRAHALRAL